MMWEIYDVLISSADSDIRIKDFAAGTYWTAVMTEDGILGLSPSIHERYQRFPFGIEPTAGMTAGEMAPGLKSWNYVEASIAMAAVNACFNRPDRIPEDAVVYPGGSAAAALLPNSAKRIQKTATRSSPNSCMSGTSFRIFLELSIFSGGMRTGLTATISTPHIVNSCPPAISSSSVENLSSANWRVR